jgi:hypothetical protein
VLERALTIAVLVAIIAIAAILVAALSLRKKHPLF